MKLKATFAPRRDGAYGRVVNTEGARRLNESPSYPIDDKGIVDVPDEYARHLISTGNFVLAAGEELTPLPSMIIANGDGTVIDLMELEKPALLQLANEIFNLNMHVQCGEKRLRDEIFAHVNKPAE